jgi:hypothetical protein
MLTSGERRTDLVSDKRGTLLQLAGLRLLRKKGQQVHEQHADDAQRMHRNNCLLVK